ncbi:PREDICTED: centrosomal protein of 112 kDa-like, partial [Acanthisitta chloris]|uniref:centrosomal protein of 112 kDa-like n=1 Tax=Acanthisitta chloris TaxID=57068 RepID=UPI0004F0CF5D
VIAELRTSISSLTEQNSRQQLAAEQRLQEVVQKLEDEKQQLMRDNDRAIKALEDKVERYRAQLCATERKLQHLSLQSQEQLINMQEEHEKILKGMMPASSRKELEDTIVSLKSQVCFLQKRVHQEDLNTSHPKKYDFTFDPFLLFHTCGS